MTTTTLTIDQTHAGLTKYPKGSARELWRIAFPLMLSLLSGSLMMFLDRLLLSYYSTDALTASVNAGTVVAIFWMGGVSVASIAEVFVGQYNGAGKKSQLGEPVWQMIWFALMTSVIFIPLGLCCGPALFAGTGLETISANYYKWLMLFGPIFTIDAALSAFFIGQGRVGFVTISTVLANGVNVGLDFLLIFGIDGILEPMGTEGAAIATGIAGTFQCALLFAAFFSKRNRRERGTSNFAFKKDSFWISLRIGSPNALATMVEIFAWAIFFRMMTAESREHGTVVAVAQSVFFLSQFITGGISKAVIAIASNFIGAREWHLVKKLFLSGVKLLLVFFALLSLVLVIFPESLIDQFLRPLEGELPPPTVKASIKNCCFWMWIFFLFDGISWVVAGILTAAGDTKFVMFAGGSAIWFFAILPIYFFVIVLGQPADITWLITAFYGVCISGIYFWRYRQNKWKSIQLINQQ